MNSFQRHSPAARLLAVSLLAIVLVSFTEFLLFPILETYRNLKIEVEDQNRLIARYESKLAELPAVKASSIELRKQIESTDTLFRSQSPSQAAVTLQGLVEAIITKQGGTITSIRTIPVEVAGRFQTIGLIADGSIPQKSLLRVLHLLRTARPTLYVKKLTLRRSQRVPQNDASMMPEEPLNLRLEVAGYLVTANL